MEFKSETDRLERINNAHLALIGYMGRTIRDKDAEIALLNEQLHATPAHGHELEAERDAKPVIPQRLIDENIALRRECVQHMVELQRLENEARDLRAEIGRLNGIIKEQAEIGESLRRGNESLQCEIAIMKGPRPFVPANATDDTSNLRELQDLQRAKDEAERSTTPAIGITEESRRFWKGDSRDLKSRLDKPAVRKVLEEGRRISKGVKYDRCVENQRVKREEGKGPRPSVSVEFKPVKIVSPVRTAARRSANVEERRLEGKA